MVVLSSAGDGLSPHSAPPADHTQHNNNNTAETSSRGVQSSFSASPSKAKKCVNITSPPASTPVIAEPVLSAAGPGGGGGSTEERAPSRVRVHFFESGAVKCPSATGTNSAMDVSVDGAPPHGGQQPQQQQMLNGSNSYFRETQQQTQHVFTTSTPNGTNVQTVTYTARQSTDSGIDNPFRPEGELSMEADEIVKAIKEGRPFDSIDSGRVSRQENGVTSMTITTTMTKTSPTSNGNNNSKSNNNNNNNNNTTSPTSPKNGSAKNGSATKSPSGKKDTKPGVVDVQRGIVVPPSEAQQAEQVVIKKKPKCKCCVIQ